MSEQVNVFEVAARDKYRFQYNGSISVEDLYSLPVKELDKIYGNLTEELKKTEVVSLLGSKTKEESLLVNKIAIVTHIVNSKLDAVKDKELEKEKKAHNQKVMAIIASKKDESLQGKSIEELEKMLIE